MLAEKVELRRIACWSGEAGRMSRFGKLLKARAEGITRMKFIDVSQSRLSNIVVGEQGHLVGFYASPLLWKLL
jgi:hypothetical protein